MQSQLNPQESLTAPSGARRFAGWAKRSWHAIAADLEPVDCGSLDVLLYCADDLVVRGEIPLRRADRAGETRPVS